MPDSVQAAELDRLDCALQAAGALSKPMFRQVAESAGERFSILQRAGKTALIDRFIEAGAWTDAVLALLAIQLPNWSVRRLVCEDGEWLCSLSRQPNLPMFLDDPAEGSHAVLALAVLRAFVAARCRSAATQQVTASVPRVRPRPAFVFCCDNLA